MIEINLLPGAGKKSRGGRSAAAGIGSALSDIGAKVKDPYLLFAVGTTAVAVLLVGALFMRQESVANALIEREQQEVQDSTRHAAVLGEKRAAEARRDSVLAQLDVIRRIDDNRFVWPHLMDEISRVMPAYTWLTSLDQTSAAVIPVATDAPPPKKAAKKPKAAKGAKDAAPVKEEPEVAAIPPMKFKIQGITVDIQALTRFMRDLEASPFVQTVQLDKSALTMVEGKEVTEFTLTGEYQQPDSTATRREPIALSVR